MVIVRCFVKKECTFIDSFSRSLLIFMCLVPLSYNMTFIHFLNVFLLTEDHMEGLECWQFVARLKARYL